jgi:hypothetical protein
MPVSPVPEKEIAAPAAKPSGEAKPATGETPKAEAAK